MTINATAAQLISAGSMDVTLRLTDGDAKAVMSATPNVYFVVGSKVYGVYEMNPTVVPNVYVVRLTASLINHIAKDTAVTFEV